MSADQPLPKILIVDDDVEFCADLDAVLADRYRVECEHTGERGIERARELEPEVVLLDKDLGAGCDGLEVLERLRGLDDPPAVIMLTGAKELEIVVQAIKLGAFHYVVKDPDPNELIHLIERGRAESSYRLTIAAQDGEIRRLCGDFIAGDPKMRALLEEIDRVAETGATVLITGECGTGKEMVARRVHEASERAERSFIGVNCGAIPAELIESELFGHEKGSFTGADHRRRGMFELAGGGTLFLDEVGDSPEMFQVKLLRVLEERSFYRVGGELALTADVRVVAATSKDLERLIEQGLFREELFYRLNICRFTLPSLRERPGDILPLARHFLGKAGVEMRREIDGFTRTAERMLTEYHWPGNVRELRNTVERAVIQCRGRLLGVGDLAIGTSTSGPLPAYEEAKAGALRQFKRRYLGAQLDRAAGNVSEAARNSDLSRQSFQRMVGECGLDPDDYRERPSG